MSTTKPYALCTRSISACVSSCRRPVSSVNTVIGNVDFAPTFATWANVDVPDFVDGSPFARLRVGAAPVHWRLEFLIKVPSGILGTVWPYQRLRDLTERSGEHVDWLGNVTFAAGLILAKLFVNREHVRVRMFRRRPTYRGSFRAW